MRWSYLIPRLIIVAMIWGFMAFGLDPLLRSTTQSALQSMIGAKADLAVLETQLFPPAFRIQQMELAKAERPGRNLAAVDSIQLQLDGRSLLRKSFVVDTAVIDGVTFDTVRADDGRLPEPAESESDEPVLPAWLTERMKSQGTQWLDNLLNQTQQALDPQQLESYQVGSEVYAKWNERFADLETRLKAARGELKALRQTVEQAKERPPLEQVQQYVDVARRADLLLRESRRLMTEFRHAAAVEGKQDFVRLDDARRRDQQRAVDQLQMLKPDARRISESLLGEQLYLQLHQLLSWVETAKSYQQGLKAPEPVRARGSVFEFPVHDPTPRFLCRTAKLSGRLSVDGVPTPFSATLRDLASDPVLHGRPTLLRLETSGGVPLTVVVRHDATGAVATTDVGLDLVQPQSRELASGNDRDHGISVAISNIHWLARLTLSDGTVQGRVDLSSELTSPTIRSSHEIAGRLAAAANESLARIRTVNATVSIDGPLRRPNIELDSDLGPKFAAAFESGYQAVLPELRSEVTGRIETLVAEKKSLFATQFQERSQRLMEEHREIIDGLTEAYTLAKNLQNGTVDADQVFRLASESGVLDEDDQNRASRYLQKHGEVMEGLQNPEKTIQDALPGLTRKLFRK